MLVKNVEEDIKIYANLVYKIAMSILGTKHDAEDVFQNVFIKLYENKKPFYDEEHKKAWLIKVTTNECKSLLRKSWYKNRNELKEDMIYSEPERDTSVLQEVKKLPVEYQIVIFLFYYEGYKEHEISKMLNISLGAVKSRLFRARNMLRETLKGGIEDEF